MKMKWIRVVAVAMIATMLCLVLASCGGTKVADAAGTLDGLTWTYVSETKTLTVVGQGEIKDFANSNEAPWASVRAGVQKIDITSGITKIGSNAFYGMSEVTEVVLPQTLTTIGKGAFAFNNKLKMLSIPAGVTTIGESAFEACGALEAVFVPNTVTTIDARAFAFCRSLKSAVVAGDSVSFGTHAFKRCVSLNNLVLSDTMVPIDPIVFSEASMNFDSATKKTAPNGDSILTINYKIGDQVVATETHTNAFGVSYSYPVTAKEGYTADRETISGIANGADKVEEVIYTANAPVESTDTPAEEETPKSMWSIILGIVIFVVVLAGIGVGAFFLFRSDKKGKKGTTVRKNDTAKKGKKK